MQPTLIEPENSHRQYFTIVPHLVWALTEDPYQFTLWCVIAMIAGEDGTCILSTRQLAEATMMSVGQCHKAREALLRLRLLHGELRRDPGYPTAVWHLRIPDLWAPNLSWRRQNPSLLERIRWKREQRATRARRRAQTRSPDEHAHTRSPDEQHRSPCEPKKIQQEEHVLDHGHDLSYAWSTILLELQLQMTRPMFDTWIRPLRPLQLTNTEAVILCPSPFILDWCDKRMRPAIERVIHTVTQTNCAVRFVVTQEATR